ncbi:hypothetical protein C2I18_17540 [Paenibacillus sp. PK3_47]|uniref:hypothetical protein n=1 Tax=Paenibacillus sp. PK3_47 TaxID=2072642 RepID=UPI00201E29F8|nr:hypothetical protein [Paenibacillus sp. PK3_47]UQZ35169.1 hypothetical protein C2I18_17540 [Paenibacillus sp. PK3_47]
MNKTLLHPLRLRRESRSFTDALYGVLESKGWFTLPKYMLAGMTGACFRFSVHRELHPDSATAYNWMAEHFVACDLIGITTSQWGGFHFTPTFPLYQEQAVLDIKRAIDSGTGAVVWKDGFVIVNGYNEQSQVFYYLDGLTESAQELPFAGFGLNVSPYAYYQIYETQIETDLLQIIKESCIQAVFRAETPDVMLPEEDYACGLAAYDAILEALQSGRFHADGAYETFLVYASAKKDAAAYTQHAVSYWPSLQEVAAQYSRLSLIYEKILETKFMQNPLPSTPVDDLTGLFRAAGEAETAAVRAIRGLLREPIANRFHDIGLR